ncbi:MAG: type IV secretory system conjugative DNA transfer family protein [Clostridia bacterium]|nr:type IV secretory system conjugative DNA transfer family protein [Clostridia bacterium]MBR2391373.1 type IV secretory system conjugative DNA transfer family protein [Clostridia bacterium]
MSKEKGFSLTNFIVTSISIVFVSIVGGVLLNYFLTNTVSLTAEDTLTFSFIIFLCLFMFYIISATGKDKNGKLKGKDSMENQHFASLKELDKHFKHCKFTELKNLSITGVPFRFELKHGNINIHFTPECHVLIVGASGTGKTACWVEPTMQILSELKNRPSVFITDPKGEIFAHHSLKFKNQGYTVLQLDLTQPYASKRWNPLENIYLLWQKRLHMEENILKHTNDPIKNYPDLLKGGEIKSSEWYEFEGKAFATLRETLVEVDVEKQKIKDDCMESLNDIASAIVPSDPDPKNKQWTDGARDYFLACMIAMLEDSENEALGMTKEKYCFFNAFKIAMNKDDDYEVVKDYFSGRDPLSKSKELSTNITQTKATVTRDGYMSSLTTNLSIFSDNGICFLTSANDIKFTEFDDKPTAFFIKIPDERATRYKLASVCISQAYKEFVQKARANETTNPDKMAHLKRPLFYILDEFANMPKIEGLNRIITVARSRWIFLNMAIQSYAQLDDVYGKEVAEIVRGQCRSTLFYGTPDLKTREEFSKELGNHTIEVDSKTKNEGSGKEKSTHSTSTSLQQVPLVHPSELDKIPLGQNITNNFQQYPCKAIVTPYFKCLDIYKIGSVPTEFIPGRTFKESEVFYDIRRRNSIVLSNDDF